MKFREVGFFFMPPSRILIGKRGPRRGRLVGLRIRSEFLRTHDSDRRENFDAAARVAAA
jgi:hypothetical protein